MISSNAFPARPPDLPPVPLMDMGFAVSCQLARHRRPYHPVLVHRPACLLHASFRPHLTATPLRFANPSPPSGWVEDFHLQAVEHARRNRHRGESRLSSPATPPYMRVRIRRFDKLVPPRNGQAERSQFEAAVRVSLLWSASFAASPRPAYQRPTEAGWLVHYPHRDPSTTDSSYRSGLRRFRDYYALC